MLPVPLPPFVCRVPYCPLTRPRAKGERPEWNLGLDYEVAFARIAQRLHCPLWVVGELTITDYLDEVDLGMYLADLDNPPTPEGT